MGGFEKLLFWSSGLCLGGSGPWKETVDPKGSHEASQLLTGTGRERGCCCAQMGAHVCLIANTHFERRQMGNVGDAD